MLPGTSNLRMQGSSRTCVEGTLVHLWGHIGLYIRVWLVWELSLAELATAVAEDWLQLRLHWLNIGALSSHLPY